MSKAEKRAIEAYPIESHEMYDDLYRQRNAYVKGYHQAEKELELTLEDVYDIWRLYNEVCSEGQIFGHDETSEEVLKRYKKMKGE